MITLWVSLKLVGLRKAAHRTVLRLWPYNLRVYTAYSKALNTVRDKLMSHDQPWAGTLATTTKAQYN